MVVPWASGDNRSENRAEPSPQVFWALQLREMFERTQACFLVDIFRIDSWPSPG